MKKLLMLLLAMMAMASLTWAQATGETAKEKATQNHNKADDRLQNAAKVMQQIMGTPDKGIPDEILKSAKCIAVVPHMIKGGFIFGAENGKGVATCRLANGNWSAPAFFTITGGSWGAQIGGKSTRRSANDS